MKAARFDGWRMSASELADMSIATRAQSIFLVFMVCIVLLLILSGRIYSFARVLLAER